jgi:drug/metabolite transporter (DMT)-like permease
LPIDGSPETRRTGAHRLGGIPIVVIALLCFGALDTTTKFVSTAAPVVMALWFRYVVQTAMTLGVLWPHQGVRLFKTRQPRLQVLRGVLLTICNAIAFFSLGVMQVGEFTAIVMLTPLLMTVIAARALHEHVSGWRWLCVLGGFAGSVVVIRPGMDLFQWALLLPLLLVLANTAFQTLTGVMARTEDPATIHLYTGLVGLAVTTAALPFAWQALPPAVWAAIGLVGVLGTMGHFLLIVAYSRESVAVLTPFLYLQIAFGSLGAWLAFGHVPDAISLLGIVLIAACGVFGTWLTGREKEARRRLETPESSVAAVAGIDGR